MSRRQMFDEEAVAGIRGLTSLTEPGPHDPVGAVVDVPVIGARGDGKTQFIVHAIRTLRAYAPVLDSVEHQYNRDVLEVVMNARQPRPDATVPGVVPHYVFRIRPDSLLSQVGFGGRMALLGRAASLGRYVILAMLNAAAIAGALLYLRKGFDPTIAMASAGVLLVGLGLGLGISRRRFLAMGEIEIVFWDVAGEHVYSASAADYYTFLSALVRERHARKTLSRSYAFAPILMCNPMSLGVRAHGSRYARLRQLIPLFATLNGPAPRAMVAINRWSAVEKICEPDSDRDEIVAIVSRARETDEDDQDQSNGHEEADSSGPAPIDVLPLVKRDVVRKHCLDAEDGNDVDVHFAYLRYDAGIQCEFSERTWNGYDELRYDIRARFRAPTSSEPTKVLDYTYEDGPGSFTGDTRRSFLNWLASMAFNDNQPARAVSEDDLDALDDLVARNPEADVAHHDEWLPRGSAASQTLHALESAIDDSLADEERLWARPRNDDSWSAEGTAPGIGKYHASHDAGDSPNDASGDPPDHASSDSPNDASDAPPDDASDGLVDDTSDRNPSATTQRGVGAIDIDDQDEDVLRPGGFRTGGT